MIFDARGTTANRLQITDADVRSICESLGNGDQITDICRRYNVTKATIYRRLRGIDCPHVDFRTIKRIPLNIQQGVYYDRREGMAWEDIADKYHRDEREIRKIFNDYRKKMERLFNAME